MGYILIVIGIAAVIAGIMILSRHDEPKPVQAVTNVEAPTAASAPVSAPVNDVAVVETPVPANDTVSELTPKEKGDAFENFVVNLLADHRLTLLDRTQDAVSSAGVVAESCKNPDLHVKQKRGKSDIDYYPECKYRSRWSDDAITFEEWQIDRYRQFQRDSHRKVIIALGVGGTADAPATFRLIPLDSIRNSAIRKIDTKYAVDPTSSALVDYMNDYFTTVFRKSKSKSDN